MAIYTQNVMLPACIYREKKGERVDWYWGVLEGEKIVAWLALKEKVFVEEENLQEDQ